MLSKFRMNNQKGFTLIELMIVIAIIGILAAIAIPNFIAYRDKSFCSAAEVGCQQYCRRYCLITMLSRRIRGHRPLRNLALRGQRPGYCLCWPYNHHHCCRRIHALSSRLPGLEYRMGRRDLYQNYALR